MAFNNVTDVTKQFSSLSTENKSLTKEEILDEMIRDSNATYYHIAIEERKYLETIKKSHPIFHNVICTEQGKYVHYISRQPLYRKLPTVSYLPHHAYQRKELIEIKRSGNFVSRIERMISSTAFIYFLGDERSLSKIYRDVWIEAMVGRYLRAIYSEHRLDRYPQIKMEYGIKLEEPSQEELLFKEDVLNKLRGASSYLERHYIGNNAAGSPSNN